MEDIVSGSVQIGQHILRFEEEDPVESEYSLKAELELRETTDLKENVLTTFKALIREERNLNVPLEGNDSFFYAFLRCCKYYPESAFHRMKKMYEFKENNERYFANVIPATEKNAFENNLLTVSPQRDQYGRRVLILQLGKKWNTSSCTLVEVTRAILLVIEAAILEPKTQICGAILILDLEGLNFQHVIHFTPKYANIILDWLQNCVPLRIKAVHILNQPYIFNMAFAVFKPFIKEKLRNRIFLHGTDRSALFDHIDPKFVPIRYSGTMDLPLDEGVLLWKFLHHHNERYERTSQYGYTKDWKKK